MPAAKASLPLVSPSEAPSRALTGAIGLAVTLLIMVGLASVQKRQVEAPPPPIENLREVALPADLPPLVARAEEPPPAAAASFIPLEAERTDSVVKLPVAPIVTDPVPVLPGLPRIDLPVTAFQPASFAPEFALRRIFNRDEVDQPCRPLLKTRPFIRRAMLRDVTRLQAVFIFIVNRDGGVENVRLIKSSENLPYDDACAEALRQWKFSPAIRQGKPVRQWAQQSIVCQLQPGSRFEVH